MPIVLVVLMSLCLGTVSVQKKCGPFVSTVGSIQYVLFGVAILLANMSVLCSMLCVNEQVMSVQFQPLNLSMYSSAICLGLDPQSIYSMQRSSICPGLAPIYVYVQLLYLSRSSPTICIFIAPPSVYVKPPLSVYVQQLYLSMCSPSICLCIAFLSVYVQPLYLSMCSPSICLHVALYLSMFSPLCLSICSPLHLCICSPSVSVYVQPLYLFICSHSASVYVQPLYLSMCGPSICLCVAPLSIYVQPLYLSMRGPSICLCVAPPSVCVQTPLFVYVIVQPLYLSICSPSVSVYVQPLYLSMCSPSVSVYVYSSPSICLCVAPISVYLSAQVPGGLTAMQALLSLSKLQTENNSEDGKKQVCLSLTPSLTPCYIYFYSCTTRRILRIGLLFLQLHNCTAQSLRLQPYTSLISSITRSLVFFSVSKLTTIVIHSSISTVI